MSTLKSATPTAVGLTGSGNEGIDGMRYINYEVCPNEQVGVAGAIVVSPDRSSAVIVRQACQDLAQPQPVPMTNLTFVADPSSPSTQAFSLAGKVYNQQVSVGDQRATIELCQSTDGSTLVQVWETYGASGAFYGTVSKGSASSGVLELQSPSGSSPNDFISLTGQSSQFDLDLTTSTVNFAIAGGASQSIAVTCATQAIPPAAPSGTGLPLDANGWTIFTASNDTRTIYVSSSLGNDSNDGATPATAVKTLAKGASMMRDGFPDWLLLNKGDTWSETFGNLCAPGRSAKEPALVSTYGSGNRPLIQVATIYGAGLYSAAGGGCAGTRSGYLAVTGLEFYAYDRDPNSPHFNPATVDSLLNGILIQNPSDWILIEDNKFSFFEANVVFEKGQAAAVALRRNVIVDSYSVSYYGPGAYFSNVQSILIEENLFDHNGWNSSVSGGGPSIARHNINIDQTCGPASVRNNLSTNASADGLQLGGGGSLVNNFFAHNPIGVQVYAAVTSGLFPAAILDNVFVEATDITPSLLRGEGILISQNGAAPIEITGNLMNQDLSQSTSSYGVLIGPGASGIAVTSNVICQWDIPIQDSGASDVILPNILSTSLCNNLGFPNPTLTIESYDSSIGGSGTLFDFVSRARLQSKDNWNPQLTAPVVNNYLRVGFGMPSL